MSQTSGQGRRPLPDVCDTCIPGFDPRASAGDCVFCVGEASRYVDFIETHIQHVKGFSGPLILEDWQRAIVGNIFGWKRPDGTRRFRKVFVYVPRKNSKTTLVAAVVLAVLILDGQRGAEIYTAAGDRDQAALVYDIASKMVAQNSELIAICQAYTASKTILLPEDGSFIRSVSAEAGTKHGYSASCVVVDELHNQPNRELVDALTTSMGARALCGSPLTIYMTTAGHDRESLCYEEYDYACKVRDAVFCDIETLPVIYEADASLDWCSPRTWAIANPNLGVSVSLEYLVAECEKAQRIPAYENTFRRLYLNQWTQTNTKWIRLSDWQATASDMICKPGDECFVGLDLSATVDLTALCMAFPLPGGEFFLDFRFWVPEDRAHDREIRDRVPYLTWARQGFIRLIPGATIDQEFVRQEIIALRDLYSIRRVAVDPWQATYMMTSLMADGFDVCSFRQGYQSMSPACKRFESLLLASKLRVQPTPVMDWMIDNVCVTTDAAGNIKPDKGSSRDKIDGVVAALMAIGVSDATQDKPHAKQSVYEQRGLLVL